MNIIPTSLPDEEAQRRKRQQAATSAAIGKKIGMPGEALKARHAEFSQQGPVTRLDQITAVDVAMALAEGTKPENIAATITRLGGNPAAYGI